MLLVIRTRRREEEEERQRQEADFPSSHSGRIKIQTCQWLQRLLHIFTCLNAFWHSTLHCHSGETSQTSCASFYWSRTLRKHPKSGSSIEESPCRLRNCCANLPRWIVFIINMIRGVPPTINFVSFFSGRKMKLCWFSWDTSDLLDKISQTMTLRWIVVTSSQFRYCCFCKGDAPSIDRKFLGLCCLALFI